MFTVQADVVRVGGEPFLSLRVIPFSTPFRPIAGSPLTSNGVAIEPAPVPLGADGSFAVTLHPRR